MSTRERVAVVSPREERRRSAGKWAPLLGPGTELALCETPAEAASADLVAIDAACTGLEVWMEEPGRAPDTVVVFGEGPKGALPWGEGGAEVLAAITERLERRRLLADSEEFRRGLAEAGTRLEEQRRRLSRLVLDQSATLRGANVELAREVDRLSRLQALARVLAAPTGDEDSGPAIAEAVARALGAAGAALLRCAAGKWEIEGAFRVSLRAARAIVPELAERGITSLDRPSTRRGHRGAWIPLGRGDGSAGLAVLLREDRDVPDRALVDELAALVADGLAAREEALAARARGRQTESILRTLRSGLLRVDREGRVAFANPALADILGIDVARLEGRGLEVLFPRDPHVAELLRSAAARGEAVEDVETWITRPSGGRVTVSLRASALGDADGPGGVLVLVSDLSRRKEVEEEVRKTERLAALGRLSAGVAHEIRNPLAGIRTTAELLRERVKDRAELGRFVDVILEETSRLDRIVGSLLQFAKPAPPRRTRVELGPLLARVRRLAAGRAAERGVAVRVRTGEGAALADRDQILQVLLNLVLNAIEATPSGGEVRLGVETAEEGEGLLVVVEDGGEGVPPEIRERVFDPFFSTKPGGTGLGLSISRNILRQHGGRLRLERPSGGAHRVVAELPPAEPVETPHREVETWRTS